MEPGYLFSKNHHLSRTWTAYQLRSITVATDGLQERIEALENRVVELETQAYQRAKDAAYAVSYTHLTLPTILIV